MPLKHIDKMGVILGQNTKESTYSMLKRTNYDFAINGSFFWTSAEVGWKNIALNTIVSSGKLINETDVFSQYGIAVRDNNVVSFEKFNRNDTTIEHFIGGSPTIIMGGDVNIDHKVDGDNSSHPRSVIGLDDDNIYFIVVDGRKNGHKGITIHSMANELKGIGIKYAINLDGGGSSGLFGKNGAVNKNESHRLLPNAIGIKIKQ